MKRRHKLILTILPKHISRFTYMNDMGCFFCRGGGVNKTPRNWASTRESPYHGESLVSLRELREMFAIIESGTISRKRRSCVWKCLKGFAHHAEENFQAMVNFEVQYNFHFHPILTPSTPYNFAGDFHPWKMLKALQKLSHFPHSFPSSSPRKAPSPSESHNTAHWWKLEAPW